MDAREKIAYLKGLLDARPLNDAAADSLVRAAVAALEALASENDELRARLDEQSETVNELYGFCGDLDADLSQIEDNLGLAEEDDEDSFGIDENFREAVCPNCGLHFFCADSMIEEDGTVVCPDCGESVNLAQETSSDSDENDG